MTNRRSRILAFILILAAGSGLLAFFTTSGPAAGVGAGSAAGSEAVRSGAARPDQAGPEAAGSEATADLRLEVNLDARRLTATLDGTPLTSYPITVGTPNHPTPRGRFAIDWIVWNPSWNPPDSEWARGKQPVGPGPDNPMGRVKMYFRPPAYYIHGTANEGEIGSAASHGCVRLRNSDVIELAQLVMQHGGEARPPGWFKRVVNRIRDTREVRLSRPVPVVIE